MTIAVIVLLCARRKGNGKTRIMSSPILGKGNLKREKAMSHTLIKDFNKVEGEN